MNSQTTVWRENKIVFLMNRKEDKQDGIVTPPTFFYTVRYLRIFDLILVTS